MIKFCLKRLIAIKSTSLLVITGIALSVFEMIGIFSLGPFISMVLNPEVIKTNEYIFFVKNFLNIEDSKDFITFFGIITLISIVFGNLNNIFHQYLVHKCSYLFGRNLSYEYIQLYLNSTTKNLQNLQDENIIKNATVEITRAVEWVIQPILGSIFRALSLMLIFLALVLYSWQISLILFLVIFFLYLFIFQSLKSWISSIGESTAKILTDKQIAVSELVQGKNIIKTYNKSTFFLDRYFDAASKESNQKAVSTLASNSPKALLEGFAFGGITLMMLYINLYASESIGTNFLASLGIFTVAAYKILPSAQNVYYGISRAQYNLASLNTLMKNILSFQENQNMHAKFINKIKVKKFHYPFISISNLSYAINNKKYILKNIDIKNDDLAIIGLIGSSGGGKTTLLNLIAGNEEPTSGTIKLSDDIDSISYVSQKLVTFRGSLIDNITMFDSSPDYDFLKILWNICEIKFCDIKDADNFHISDNASNISGGQNQRINLARALYLKPKLLLLDEFTSALDNDVEKNILEKLSNYTRNNNIKIIMSAHRDSAKSACDIFYEINQTCIDRRYSI